MSKIKQIKNFTISEFNSKDGAEMPQNVRDNVIDLAINLQALRDYLNAPITITSGYRSPKHNSSIGGAKNSYHVKGMAADIKAEGFTPSEVIRAILILINEGKMKEGGIGRYPSWVHYDIRGYEARW